MRRIWGCAWLMDGFWTDDRIYCPLGPHQFSHSQIQVPRDSWPSCCLRFETPPTWRARPPYLYPSGTGWSSYNTRHWVIFRRLLRFVGLPWRYSNPPPHGILPAVICLRSSSYSLGADRQKTPSLNSSLHAGRCCGNMFTEQFPSNGSLLWLHYSGFQTSCHYIVGCSLLSSW
jgi:hypothetical protein